MVQDKRKHPRTKLMSAVGYRLEKGRSFGNCTAKDVSEHGLKIHLEEFIPPGTLLELQFKLPPSPKFLTVEGKVVWINKLPYNEQWEAGVDLQMDVNFAALVHQFISANEATHHAGPGAES